MLATALSRFVRPAVGVKGGLKGALAGRALRTAVHPAARPRGLAAAAAASANPIAVFDTTEGTFEVGDT